MAQFLGVKYVLTVNSGSSANLVAFSALTSPRLGDRAIKPGDEVISVAAGFPTTVNPILQFGAVPVFVDVDIPTYNIDPAKIEAAITPKTKAIMLAHTLGNPYDLDVVTALARKYNLWLIEDSCDALGSTYNGQLVGTFGDNRDPQLLPRSPHHYGRGRRRLYQKFAAEAGDGVVPRLGAATATARRGMTIPATSVSAGSWATCRRATTTNILTRIWAIT